MQRSADSNFDLTHMGSIMLPSTWIATQLLAAEHLATVFPVQDVLMRHKAMVASYLTRNYDQVR